MSAWPDRGPAAGGQAAVFLDRDGTLIEDVAYLSRPAQVALYPWTVAAVRSLNRAGFRVVLVTNQSGVARGFFDELAVADVHRHIAGVLEAGGAFLDAYYYCPHHPDGRIVQYAQTCECRKPAQGLVTRAVAELGIDPRQSFVVGDRWRDVALGRGVGARSVLVRTGAGAREESQPQADLSADVVVDNLIEAVGWILTRAR